MKIVVLDGYAENPGDLSWEGFKKMGGLRCMTGRRGRMWKRFFTGSEMRKSFVPTKRSLEEM